ncbi:hypothetical protein ABZP36_029223 [Zizania latifolia]
MVHTVGWPLGTKTYGGSFIYHLGDRHMGRDERGFVRQPGHATQDRRLLQDIRGVSMGTISDAPSGAGGAYLQTSIMGASYRDYIDIVFENSKNEVQSWHIDGYAFWVAEYANGWGEMVGSKQADLQPEGCYFVDLKWKPAEWFFTRGDHLTIFSLLELLA